MKNILLTLFFILSISCVDKKVNENVLSDNQSSKEIFEPKFQSILDSAHLKGSILIHDFNKNKYYSNDFNWAREGHLPASTFKIANSIIGLEIGIIENDQKVFEWDGEERMFESWEQDLILKDAFHFSCVPCYQELAREIGSSRMNLYLEKLDYGNIDVDSTNIDLFWLAGESTISQFQQLDFLERFYSKDLPISVHTYDIMKTIMIIEDVDYKLSGKTGWSIMDGLLFY